VLFLALLGANLLLIFDYENKLSPEIPLLLPDLLLSLLILSVYIFFQQNITRSDSANIIDLLWKVFVTGLLTTIFSLATRLVLWLLEHNQLAENPYFLATLHLVNVGLMVVFLTSTFTVWKRLILYQKSKNLLLTWNIFQYSLLAGLLLSISNLQLFDWAYNIGLGLLIVLTIVLSVNLKWVPYLNFKQKWKSILLLTLVAMYLLYFLSHLFFNTDYNRQIIQNLTGNVALVAAFIFVLIYIIFSILVILFNLPTSSVFEQKLEEVINFQRLSQSRSRDQGEDQVYDILLESSVSAVIANAAWLDVSDHHGTGSRSLYFKMDEKKRLQIEEKISEKKVKKLMGTDALRVLKSSKYTTNIKDYDYRSVLVFPLVVQERSIGKLVLLKDLEDGFNKEMIEIIRTFVNQACISIENYRLLDEAIENERYKEELKIARQVQGSLLPVKLDKNDDIDIVAYSRSAAEVGGDYYDTYKINDHRLALIIADVSGKGTSAAFHMSQMKGIFQSLVQLDLPPKQFMVLANHALSNCLDRTSFITTSYFVIDEQHKSLYFTRAGHCPTIYYSKAGNSTNFLEDNGLGLGILRDHNFEAYIDVQTKPYASGDLLFLYTDGITEAKNEANEEFGYERLERFIKENAGYSTTEIKDRLLKYLLDFCGPKPPEDDLTVLVVKFL
jgi:serine phosphatase RsbU (regulator of sigma subunit)